VGDVILVEWSCRTLRLSGAPTGNGDSVMLDPVLADRIIDTVRPFLPDGFTIHRRRKRTLVGVHRSSLGHRSSMSISAFGHLARGNAPVQAVAESLDKVLASLNSFFYTEVNQRWKGLDAGRPHVDVQVTGGQVHATITDPAGHVLNIGPLGTTP
jgi:hypothetical protein